MVERPPLSPCLIFPRAEADLTSAFDHYESQEAGLGLEFLRSFEAALAMLRRYPEAAPKVRGEVRRVLFRRFSLPACFTMSERVRSGCSPCSMCAVTRPAGRGERQANNALQPTVALWCAPLARRIIGCARG